MHVHVCVYTLYMCMHITQTHITLQVSKVRRAQSDDEAKAVIKAVVKANFFQELSAADGDLGVGGGTDSAAASGQHSEKHLRKVVEWFHASLMKRSPWSTWTNDIYDAMRCIDHLPIG